MGARAIAAARFEAEGLRPIDGIDDTGGPSAVTRRRRPVAVPGPTPPRALIAAYRGLVAAESDGAAHP